jgi:hypothetical protein
MRYYENKSVKGYCEVIQKFNQEADTNRINDAKGHSRQNSQRVEL